MFCQILQVSAANLFASRSVNAAPKIAGGRSDNALLLFLRIIVGWDTETACAGSSEFKVQSCLTLNLISDSMILFAAGFFQGSGFAAATKEENHKRVANAPSLLEIRVY